MSPDLPPLLRLAADRLLEGVARKGLAERAGKISDAYRAGRTSAAVVKDGDDATAYVLARLPATYAACARAFDEAAQIVPDFAPNSLLDAGAGPGGAAWAALETWPGLETATWLDASPPFLALAGRLAAGGPAPLRTADAQRADLTSGGPWPRAELVTASYALAEIAPERQAGVVQSLWDACDGVLALIEPGTPAGYGRILAARQALIAGGANILAPCPHHEACPLSGSDWCHFSVRLARSRDHRLAKGAEVPFEDERFAYLLAARPPVTATPRAPRILAPPRVGKPGIEFKLCGSSGLEQRFVARRDKAQHAIARRLGWGDVLP